MKQHEDFAFDGTTTSLRRAMSKPRTWFGVAVLVLASTVPLSVAGGAASATTLYVSPSAMASAADTSCTTAAFSLIPSAISAASPGTTIIVCPGTYPGPITVPLAITLVGVNATINAAGANNGVVIPASGATLEGFTIEGAQGEGVLVTGTPGHPVTHVTVSGNIVKDNDQGNPTGAPISTSSYRECNATGVVPGDCGEGIHLMVAAYSVVSNNLVENNSGGILVTDEFGPADHNVIVNNTVADNTLDCGITLPSHSTTAYVNGKLNAAAGGVFDNLVVDNTLLNNGTTGQGAGILLAAAAPGGAVYNNVIRGNTVDGNGMSGITVHQHAPNQYLDHNVLVGNEIGVNNLLGDPDFQPADTSPTGILIGSVAPLRITILRNTISNNTYGVWASASVKMNGLASNTFQSDTTTIYRAP